MGRKLTMLALVLLLVAVVPSSVMRSNPDIPMVWPERSGIYVMTFNIRTSLTTDILNNWLLRRSLVERVIREEAPDVILLQEANPIQISGLRRTFPSYRIITAGQGAPWNGYPAIMIRAERFAPVSTDRVWMSEAPWIEDSVSWGNVRPRCITTAILWDKLNRRRFLVASVHLDHRSAKSRKESVKLLSAWYRDHRDLPVVLGGDFNVNAESATLNGLRSDQVMSRLEDRRLRDSYRAVHDPDKGTLHGFTGKAKKRVDLVLVSQQWGVKDSWIVRTHEGSRYPSDHYPVVAVLEFPAKSIQIAKR